MPEFAHCNLCLFIYDQRYNHACPISKCKPALLFQIKTDLLVVALYAEALALYMYLLQVATV